MIVSLALLALLAGPAVASVPRAAPLPDLRAAAAPLAPPGAAPLVKGPDHVELDLWRGSVDADKVWVMAGFPDGSEALFLLDTGAAISVVRREVVEKLGLPVGEADGMVAGLSGAVPWRRAVLPELKLGAMTLADVQVAVDVPGTPEGTGPHEVAGILGNNVWANFTCVLDYRADVVELWRPGAYRMPGRSAPLVVDQLHPLAQVRIVAEDGTRADLILEVDTGARDVLLLGPAGEPFRKSSTVGVEPILGIGASLDDLPLESFLRETRRVPLARVETGAARLPLDARARWYDADGREDFGGGLPGLLGYLPVAERRLILDFPGGRLRIDRSRRAPRDFDAVGAGLARELARGDDPARAAVRARLLHAAGKEAESRAALEAGLRARPDDAELAGLLAWTLRTDGDLEGATRTLAAFTPARLAEEGLWTEYVGGLVLLGRATDAREASAAALRDAPAEPAVRAELLVGLSDALVVERRFGEAVAAIEEATQLSPAGSAHLLRRARIAALDGDRHGAMAALRRLVGVYPFDGVPLWLYATLATDEDRATFRADVERAMARLHPGDEPLDFLGAALLAVGEEAPARAALARGVERDCAPMRAGPERDNCTAWYAALGRERLDEARALAEAAVAAEPRSSAFRDTAAMVALVSGDVEGALAHARVAARLSPADPYLLWQLARLDTTLGTP